MFRNYSRLTQLFETDINVKLEQDNDAALKILSNKYSAKLRHCNRVHRVNIASICETLEKENTLELRHRKSEFQRGNSLTKVIPPCQWQDTLNQLCVERGWFALDIASFLWLPGITFWYFRPASTAWGGSYHVMTYIEVYSPPLHAVAVSCLLYIQAVKRCYYLAQERSLRCRPRFFVWVYWEVAVYPNNNIHIYIYIVLFF